MKTKTRLTLWLGLLTLLVLVLGSVSLGTIWNLGSEGKDVLKANYNSIDYAQRMLEALDLEGDTTIRAHVLVEQLANQKANITESGEAELTERLSLTIDAFRASAGDMNRSRDLRRALNGIIDVNRAAIVHKAADAEDRADRAFIWISIAGTLCFLITFTLFLSLPERIAEPIRILTEGIDRIAEGNYRERVVIEGGGEFGHMAERFNAMSSELERWENSNLARIMDEKARAEAVINSLQDASIGLDEQGRILFVNRQALELLGLEARHAIDKPAAEVAQRNDLLRLVLDDRTHAPFKAVVAGKENYFISSSTPIQGVSGALGAVYTVRNITPFQERDQAKTQFLATISHELKTPLASTDIGLGLLERSNALGSDQRAILGDLRKDHQRLVRIVSELLNLAHAESGKLEIQRVPFHLGDALEEAIGAVHNTADQCDVSITRHGIMELPAVVGDLDKTVWVLVNLLGNAIRYAPPGSTVDVVGKDLQGTVSIAVRDQGPGIPADLRPHVFERFTHGRTRTEPHAGLGLAICREFMNAMGGGIAYASDRTDGATFTLTFMTTPTAG